MTDDRFHRAVYVISVAAELAGMHPQTLRIYERRGLLEPARTTGGRRRYSDADLALLERIAELTGEGINLAGVQRILELEQQMAELQNQLAAAHEDHLAELAAHGWRAGGLGPDRPQNRAVTLYRGRRAPVSGRDAEIPGAVSRGRDAEIPGAVSRGRDAEIPGAVARGRDAEIPGAVARGRE